MKQEKLSTFGSGMIWFGAAVSMAEILTGTLVAPLGFTKGLSAILLGHVIGCVLLYFAGIIGGKYSRSAMETVKMSFGQKGSVLFSALNVLQLVGWTAVMIVSAAAAAKVLAPSVPSWIFCLIVGALILVWVLAGVKTLGRINAVAMTALFVLTIVLCFVILKKPVVTIPNGTMTFGAAVELSVAMPLSWLPLISDYTKNAKKPKNATLVSTITYFFASSWMYIIGMGAAIFAGEADIAVIMKAADLGLAGMVIIIISTVTTTFLDVYSAGVSAVSIFPKLNEKWTAVVVCIIGTGLAIFAPITQFENFLYLIGSVFAPMIAVLITDVLILKKDMTDKAVCIQSLVVWALGFVIYRVLMQFDTWIGNTAPDIIITMAICLFAHLLSRKRNECKQVG